jgi:hypothetical protein
MENTPQQNTELAAKAKMVAVECKQTEERFNMLQTMQKNLDRITNLKVSNKEMEEDIAKKVAALKIETPK